MRSEKIFAVIYRTSGLNSDNVYDAASVQFSCAISGYSLFVLLTYMVTSAICTVIGITFQRIKGLQIKLKDKAEL
jgi:hypothetical protein